ncbi:MAG: anthranilate phosphoribosyltransferase [Lachnospiraceae bacterium]|nr:anthranilate phosphoribosyltransferase [Lachnospiraceae bacterium]
MIQEAIHKVINKTDLTYEEAKEVMQEIMSGTASQVQMATYLTALRMKGETITEITASAQTMRDMAVQLTPGYEVLEIVGTGGDEVGTFNISTTSAFIVAAAGYPVAKHGNRSVSSKSGAADVLESLGVNLMISPEANQKVMDEQGMAFLFAQKHHSSMKNVGPVRKEMGERTVFNILGPLTNPASATRQLLGVYDRALVEKLAQVLSNLGVKRGISVCGSDGLDEITLTGPTYCCKIDDGVLTTFEMTPEQFGLERCELKDLIGGTPAENAEITKNILMGKEKGPKRDIVALNAGIGIYICKDNATMEEGVQEAIRLIDSGKAYEKLQEFVAATNKENV